MGMAASQARYLALVARKSNCEYQGQQINQARLNLSNQTAVLFNQMLGLKVPVPPSTQDFTTTQYSFTDGVNPCVIDKWEQLSDPDDNGYNYNVEYHYEANVYKGFGKRLNDPQVQYSNSMAPSLNPAEQRAKVKEIYDAQKEVAEAQADYDKKYAELIALRDVAASPSSYKDTIMSNVKVNSPQNPGCSYVIKDNNNNEIYLTSYDKFMAQADDDDKVIAKDYLDTLRSDGIDVDERDVYLCTNDDGDSLDSGNQYIVLSSELLNMAGDAFGGSSVIMQGYGIGAPDTPDTTPPPYTIYGMEAALAAAQSDAENAKIDLDQKQLAYENIIYRPTFVGNNELTSLGELTDAQFAEIKQVILDMTANGADCNFTRCFSSPLSIDKNCYTGGIYSFERDGVTYYTTFYDLHDAASESTFRNDIDNQPQLKYYHANYVKDNIYTSEKAVFDTSSMGRFKTVRFEDGSTYTLNFEQVTDDDAYQDAMNQYYYENARYDKMIQDINAKTSLIHQEDQQLELRLKQLDTEQAALTNEIDAVAKVAKDNVEKSFKTFGG